MTVSKKENLVSRPPVVVVLGHVDHGKSSLLEAIKDFEITSKESGGITQHVGAYEVDHKGKKITFIDTPGHEAFSAMRARGAQVADIAILVVDAADAVQPQTKEAIEVIKKSGIPMVVALNKIDKETADPAKIKRELSNIDVFVESIGGKIPSVEVSAKTKKGINELLELILLVAEMADLKTDLNVSANGVVIESYVDCFKGMVATLIVKNGILSKKDIIGTSSAYAKIKNLEDFQGKNIKEANPSQPVIVLGFEKSPWVGEEFKTYNNIEEALAHINKSEEKKEVFIPIDPNDPRKVLNVVLKVDVSGSLEAIEEILNELPKDKVILRIMKSEIGDINESDKKLVEDCNGQIIGFRVNINPSLVQAMKKDKEKRIKIKTFDVIYSLTQEVRQMMEKTLEPEIVRKDVGKMKVSVVFWGEGRRQIVGGKIFEGEFKKGLKLEVQRGGERVGEGKMINLQRNKKDVDKLIRGDECGILFEGGIKIQEGDTIVIYTEERIKGEL